MTKTAKPDYQRTERYRAALERQANVKGGTKIAILTKAQWMARMKHERSWTDK